MGGYVTLVHCDVHEFFGYALSTSQQTQRKVQKLSLASTYFRMVLLLRWVHLGDGLKRIERDSASFAPFLSKKCLWNSESERIERNSFLFSTDPFICHVTSRDPSFHDLQNKSTTQIESCASELTIKIAL